MKKGKLLITLFFIVILVYFLINIDYGESKDIIENANFKYLLFAALIFPISYFLKALRIKVLTSYYNENLTLAKSYQIDVISILFASFTPGRVGEFSKILLYMKEKISKSKSFIMPIIERLFDFIVIFLFTLLFVINRLQVLNITYSIYIFGILLFIAFIMLFNLDKLIKIFPRKIKQRLLKHINEIKLNPKDPKLLFILLLTVITWLSDGFGFYLCIKAVAAITYFDALGIFCALVIFTVLSILPSGLGSLDVSAFFLFKTIGIGDATTVVILLFLRIVTFIFPIIMFLPALPFINFNLAEIKQKISSKFNKEQ